MNVNVSHLLLLVMALCALLGVLQAQAFPGQPVAPPVNASPEDIVKYMRAVRHYLNLITRQRYGKRMVNNEVTPKWWNLQQLQEQPTYEYEDYVLQG
uniref:peptide YY-like n=1 Tax=Myxine glutinosa TaxID=7769 RepID=UPI00358E5A75